MLMRCHLVHTIEQFGLVLELSLLGWIQSCALGDARQEDGSVSGHTISVLEGLRVVEVDMNLVLLNALGLQSCMVLGLERH